MDTPINEELKKQKVLSPNQYLATGSRQTNKPAIERTKNENGVIVWLIFESQFKIEK
jgi:hypothetical protein